MNVRDFPVLLNYLFCGRCRRCQDRFFGRCLLVELMTGGLFIWCFTVAGSAQTLIKMWLLMAFLVVITFIDIDHRLILDKVLLWFAGTGLAVNLLLVYNNWWTTLLDMAIAALAGGGIMLLVAIVSRGGMGGGDIKFMAALGIWFGWKLTLLVLFLSFIAGGLGGLLVLVLGLKGRKDFIPFGPFIALGAVIGQFYGSSVIAWYLGHFIAR